jgi:sialate O-acetylesterase
MKRISQLLISTFLMLAVSVSISFAEVKLPAIFGDNMVLQQQSDVAIWGKAKASSTVRVTTSWNNKSYSVQAGKDGNWKVKVATVKAGGPYVVTISDGKELKLNNVLLGEVWVCSGQSNMEMPVKGFRNQPIVGSNQALAESDNPDIHLITVTKKTSLTPLDDFTGSWSVAGPETVSQFSATAYFFGRLLNKALKVPVGLINTSWGGTRIEPWISEAGCKNFNWVKLPDQAMTGNISQQLPTVLFNAMINPMVGYGIRGAIWYQGEANRNEPKEYQQLLPGLVQNWRSLWGVGDFPFYYAQIAPYDYLGGRAGTSSAFVREAQLKAMTAIPGIGMASLMDIGEKDCIHPANKEITGSRLAYWALVKTYGKKGFAFSGPVFKELKVEGSQAKLTFDYAENGLTSFGKELSCFEIAGKDKRFFPAKAMVVGTGVTVISPMVAEPVAVRYAFKDFIVGDLFNTEGLPASSFRTDDWE